MGVSLVIVRSMALFFLKQKTAYAMRISDWSSDVCSSDLAVRAGPGNGRRGRPAPDCDRVVRASTRCAGLSGARPGGVRGGAAAALRRAARHRAAGGATLLLSALWAARPELRRRPGGADRSEEHTSELQSLMRISYAVFCLKKKKTE